MHIEVNKLYKNKTLEYLMPKLRKHQDLELITYLHSLNILAVGIGDYNLSEKLDNQLFILVNIKFNPRIFAHFLEHVQSKDYYNTDYCFDNFNSGSMHMVVLNFHESDKGIIPLFLEGKYSQLYAVNEALDIIKNEDVIDVILKEQNCKNKFLQKVKDEFGTVLTLKEIEGRELDLPPNKHKEIFNYREPSQ